MGSVHHPDQEQRGALTLFVVVRRAASAVSASARRRKATSTRVHMLIAVIAVRSSQVRSYRRRSQSRRSSDQCRQIDRSGVGGAQAGGGERAQANDHKQSVGLDKRGYILRGAPRCRVVGLGRRVWCRCERVTTNDLRRQLRRQWDAFATASSDRALLPVVLLSYLSVLARGRLGTVPLQSMSGASGLSLPGGQVNRDRWTGAEGRSRVR